MSEELFDVIIVEKRTRAVASVIGRAMKSWDGTGSGHTSAELRMQTGQERINDRYECVMAPEGRYKEGDAIE